MGIDHKILDQVYLNMREYLNYVNEYVPLIKILEKSSNTKTVNIDEYVVKENGKYIVFIPKVLGEADIVAGGTIFKHRYAGNYRLGYAYAFEADMKAGDTIIINFINKNDRLGHHGIISPIYGVQYSKNIKILKL